MLILHHFNLSLNSLLESMRSGMDTTGKGMKPKRTCCEHILRLFLPACSINWLRYVMFLHDFFSFSSPKETHDVVEIILEFRDYPSNWTSITELLGKHGGIFRKGLNQRGTFQLIGCSETRLSIAHILLSSTKLKVLLLLCDCFNELGASHVGDCLML